MKNILKYFKSNFHIWSLLIFSILVFLVNLRINLFSYSNFDFGKFDLGNMTQMVWNTLNGRFMYLTDYFGKNMPRWGMSHVDPILLLFVPIFAVFQSPLTLVVSQLFLVVFTSLLLYKIALLELENKWASWLMALSYLFYPAVGFLTARTAFHGVTAVIPFFLSAFYIFELMYKSGNFSKGRLLFFWVFLVLTMSGKEQVPLYVLLYGIFILFFRTDFFDNFKRYFTPQGFKTFLNLTQVRHALVMVVVSAVWFITAFFVIIPKYAHYRIDGYREFAEMLEINTENATDVDLPNYFLSRYDAFGESYSEVIVNVILHPEMVVRVIFGGDKTENLTQTFLPLLFIPLAAPHVFVMAIPDLMINYLTSAGGIGTGEITNHRISMIVPVLFLSVIYFVSFIGNVLRDFKWKKFNGSVYRNMFMTGLAGAILLANIYTSFSYNNPVYLWLTQAVSKRLPTFIAWAKTDVETAIRDDLVLGEVLRLSELENKDRECAEKIVDLIPEDASISGPDYLGAHLSMRETYAIFPALYKTADYVIVDVFSRKISSILDLNTDINRDVVERLIKNDDYQLETGCGNLFVFKNIGPHGKSDVLPIQERYTYEEKVNWEILWGLSVVDYTLDTEFKRGVLEDIQLVYSQKDDYSLDGFVMFMSFIHEDTGDLYQVANLPSFGILQPNDWEEGRYYVEDVQIALPQFLQPGKYKVFVGMGNKIKTRSIYLGNVTVL